MIELRGARKSYPGHGVALEGLDLRVEGGERFALVGPSGGGKTTLLRLIAGLEAPDAGDVRLNGASVLRVPPEKRDLGVVLQRPLLFPHLSVGENLAFGLRARGMRGAAVSEKVGEMLSRVRLEGLGARRPHQLSGGQQQRAALARALITAPRALLLDEPFSALDAPLRRELRAWLIELHEASPVATLLVTHDQEEATLVGQRVGFLRAGQLEQVGAPQELYARPATLAVARFFGGANFVPGTQTGHVVRTPLGEFGVAAARSGRVTLTFRPEALLPTEGDDARNVVRGRVARAVFAGTHREVVLRAGDFELIWRAPILTQVAAGDLIALRCPPQACWTLPEA